MVNLKSTEGAKRCAKRVVALAPVQLLRKASPFILMLALILPMFACGTYNNNTSSAKISIYDGEQNVQNDTLIKAQNTELPDASDNETIANTEDGNQNAQNHTLSMEPRTSLYKDFNAVFSQENFGVRFLKEPYGFTFRQAYIADIEKLKAFYHEFGFGVYGVSGSYKDFFQKTEVGISQLRDQNGGIVEIMAPYFAPALYAPPFMFMLHYDKRGVLDDIMFVIGDFVVYVSGDGYEIIALETKQSTSSGEIYDAESVAKDIEAMGEVTSTLTDYRQAIQLIDAFQKALLPSSSLTTMEQIRRIQDSYIYGDFELPDEVWYFSANDFSDEEVYVFSTAFIVEVGYEAYTTCRKFGEIIVRRLAEIMQGDIEYESLYWRCRKENPINEQLPYSDDNRTFRVDWKMNMDESITLLVTLFMPNTEDEIWIQDAKEYGALVFETWLDSYRNETGDMTTYTIEYVYY